MDPTDPALPPWRRLATTFACGAAMGTADAVPGVSGGTVALIIGFYETFIGSIAAVLRAIPGFRDPATRRAGIDALKFLVPLGVGMGLFLYLGSVLLVTLLVDASSAPVVYAFFFGLVLASVPEPWRARKDRAWFHWLLVPVGMAISVGLSLHPLGGGSRNLVLVVGAGAIAISVMLLPGVSGTLSLVVLGMYQVVASSIKPPLDLPVAACFALGICLGAATFIPLLRLLLKRVHDGTMALLTGLMAGSLVALWPWKAHYVIREIPTAGPMAPQLPVGTWWWPALAAVVGAGIIVAVEVARRRKARPATAGETA